MRLVSVIVCSVGLALVPRVWMDVLCEFSDWLWSHGEMEVSSHGWPGEGWLNANSERIFWVWGEGGALLLEWVLEELHQRETAFSSLLPVASESVNRRSVKWAVRGLIGLGLF